MTRHGENIHKRKDGRWEARYICGYGENGKARYKYLYGKTYMEAREKKLQYITQQKYLYRNDVQLKTTFGQLLSDWLISTQTNVKESTYAKYSFAVKKHITPALGGILLINLKSEDIDRYVRNKLGNGKLNKEGGLAPKTIICHLSIIKLVLAFGRERGYCCPDHIVVRNPRQFSPEIQVLSVEEQQRLENYVLASPDRIHMGIVLTLYTGMRIGDADGKISLNQQKPSKHAGLRRFGPEKFLQRNNEFMKERPIFYKKPIKTEKDFSTWLRCFYYTTKAVITEYIYF